MLTEHECSDPSVDPGELRPGEATNTPDGRPVEPYVGSHRDDRSPRIRVKDLARRLAGERETAGA
jgi:hypothetical protein